MGNSAMKCFRGRDRTVSLVQLRGETVEFKEPAQAVMKRYPQHAVLHCSAVCKDRKACRRTPEQTLERNQNYLITPIQRGGNAKPFTDSSASWILSANKELDVMIEQKARRLSLNKRSWFQKICDMIFRFSKSYHRLEGADATAETGQLLDCKQLPLRFRKSCERLQEDWRPSLERIPESHDVES